MLTRRRTQFVPVAEQTAEAELSRAVRNKGSVRDVYNFPLRKLNQLQAPRRIKKYRITP
jgi:hypothetical protein